MRKKQTKDVLTVVGKKLGRPPVKRELVVTILKQIERKKGHIKPQDLVEVARAETSPIHDMFEWNDEKAGENFRIWQARMIISKVEVELIGESTDAYYSAEVQINDVPVRGYFSAERVLTDDEIYASVVKDAVQQLRHWQKKYKDIKELRSIVDLNGLKALEASLI